MHTEFTVQRVNHFTTITKNKTRLVGLEPTSMVLETTILPLNYNRKNWNSWIRTNDQGFKDLRLTAWLYSIKLNSFNDSFDTTINLHCLHCVQLSFFIDPLKRICKPTLNLLVLTLLDSALNLLDVSESQYYLMTSIVTSSRWGALTNITEDRRQGAY